MLSAPTGPIPPVLPSCSSTRTRTSLSSPLHHSVPSGSDLPPVLPFPGEPRPGLSSGRCRPCAGHLQHHPARPAHACWSGGGCGTPVPCCSLSRELPIPAARLWSYPRCFPSAQAASLAPAAWPGPAELYLACCFFFLY